MAEKRLVRYLTLRDVLREKLGYYLQVKRFYAINYYHNDDRIRTAPENRHPDDVSPGDIFRDDFLVIDATLDFDWRRSLLDSLDKKHRRYWYNQTVVVEKLGASAGITDEDREWVENLRQKLEDSEEADD